MSKEVGAGGRFDIFLDSANNNVLMQNEISSFRNLDNCLVYCSRRGVWGCPSHPTSACWENDYICHSFFASLVDNLVFFVVKKFSFRNFGAVHPEQFPLATYCKMRSHHSEILRRSFVLLILLVNKIYFINELPSTEMLKVYTLFLNKQLLYKQGSTRQGKKLSNFSTRLKAAKQFEKLYFQYLTGNVN